MCVGITTRLWSVWVLTSVCDLCECSPAPVTCVSAHQRLWSVWVLTSACDLCECSPAPVTCVSAHQRRWPVWVLTSACDLCKCGWASGPSVALSLQFGVRDCWSLVCCAGPTDWCCDYCLWWLTRSDLLTIGSIARLLSPFTVILPVNLSVIRSVLFLPVWTVSFVGQVSSCHLHVRYGTIV